MAGGDGRPLWVQVVQKPRILEQEQLKEGSLQHWQVAVAGRSRSRGKIVDRKLEGSLLLAGPMEVADRGRSGEEGEEDDLPCAVVACRKHLVHIQDGEGSPLDVRRLDGQGVGSKDHSEGGEAVCASD